MNSSILEIVTAEIKGVRKGGVGVKNPPWAWYFRKTLWPSQGDVFSHTFAY